MRAISAVAREPRGLNAEGCRKGTVSLGGNLTEMLVRTVMEMTQRQQPKGG